MPSQPSSHDEGLSGHSHAPQKRHPFSPCARTTQTSYSTVPPAQSLPNFVSSITVIVTEIPQQIYRRLLLTRILFDEIQEISTVLAESSLQPTLPLFSLLRICSRRVSIDHRKLLGWFPQFHRHSWGGIFGRRMWRRWWRHSIALISLSIALVRATIPRPSVRRCTMTILFQDGALKLRGSSEAVEAIIVYRFWFWHLLYLINGAVLAAGIGRVAPLICCMTSSS